MGEAEIGGGLVVMSCSILNPLADDRIWILNMF